LQAFITACLAFGPRHGMTHHNTESRNQDREKSSLNTEKIIKRE